MALHLWPVAPGGPVRLRLDGQAPRLIRGLIFSKSLAQQAEAAGLSRLQLELLGGYTFQALP